MNFRSILKYLAAGAAAALMLAEPAMAEEPAARQPVSESEASQAAGSVAETESELSTEMAVDPKKPFVAYMSGVDTRAEVLEQSNGDVNVLAVVNPETHNILLLNTPRDYYIQNPAGGNAMDKLTHCAAYGIGNSEKALSQLYGCDVDYYMQVNFVGFEKIIDSIGGVTVYSDEAFTTSTQDGQVFTVNEGENYLNGAQALAFARDRMHVAYGDNGRGRDQMRLIEGVIDTIAEDPSRLDSNLDEFLKGLGGTFETNIPVLTVFSMLSEQMGDPKPEWNIREYAVTGHNGVDKTYSMSEPTNVMYQDPDLVAHASELIRDVLGGQNLTDEMVGEIVQEW